jgi:hypothetical protein
MRIQETDRILKEARVARNGAQQQEHESVITRTWRKLTSMFKRD